MKFTIPEYVETTKEGLRIAAHNAVFGMAKDTGVQCTTKEAEDFLHFFYQEVSKNMNNMVNQNVDRRTKD